MLNFSSNNYTTGQRCWVELPCGRIKTDAGLFLAFLLTWHCRAIYDDDISIPSHSRPVDLVSTAQQPASCSLLVLMVLRYLCTKAYRVEKHLARKCLYVGQQLRKAVKLNNLNFKKSFYNWVITDMGWWRHLVEHREDQRISVNPRSFFFFTLVFLKLIVDLGIINVTDNNKNHSVFRLYEGNVIILSESHNYDSTRRLRLPQHAGSVSIFLRGAKGCSTLCFQTFAVVKMLKCFLVSLHFRSLLPNILVYFCCVVVFVSPTVPIACFSPSIIYPLFPGEVADQWGNIVIFELSHMWITKTGRVCLVVLQLIDWWGKHWICVVLMFNDMVLKIDVQITQIKGCCLPYTGTSSRLSVPWQHVDAQVFQI